MLASVDYFSSFNLRFSSLLVFLGDFPLHPSLSGIMVWDTMQIAKREYYFITTRLWSKSQLPHSLCWYSDGGTSLLLVRWELTLTTKPLQTLSWLGRGQGLIASLPCGLHWHPWVRSLLLLGVEVQDPLAECLGVCWHYKEMQSHYFLCGAWKSWLPIQLSPWNYSFALFWSTKLDIVIDWQCFSSSLLILLHCLLPCIVSDDVSFNFIVVHFFCAVVFFFLYSFLVFLFSNLTMVYLKVWVCLGVPFLRVCWASWMSRLMFFIHLES